MITENISYYSQSRPEILTLVPSNIQKALDVGCAAGGFGSALKEKQPNLDLYGIEYNAEAAKKAARIYEKIWVGDVNEVFSNKIDSGFDLIVFNDILEHIVDPWLCLQLAKNWLNPEGLVIASIPNIRFWPVLSDLIFQQNWRYREAGVMDKTHLRFFTKKSIRHLFNETGYKITEMHGINKTWKVSMRWWIINSVFLGRFEDCLYPQYAIIAKPTSDK